MSIKTKAFWDLRLVDVSWQEWGELLHVLLARQSASTTIIMTPNPEQIVLAARDEAFHDCLRAADYLLPDGQGLVWASGAAARLTGADTCLALLALAHKQNLKILLVGGRYQAPDGRLRVVANGQTYDLAYAPGYQQARQPTDQEEQAIRALIAHLRPEIVLVALGAPTQEQWLIDHRELLRQSRVRLAMAVGGSFDFLTGRLRRAPTLWQKFHLEWLYRLWQEPHRWRRQLALPVFVYKKITGQWRTIDQ
ncbi:WecB/TagA/CpsF family glycosyltransferase [bacterium]|nr:WecB/TagA/CpsF family glycosyltransferase [bacterium]